MKAKTLSLFIAALLALSIAGTAQAQVWSITLTPIPAKGWTSQAPSPRTV
jgi:hypothetical protein